MMSGKNAAEDLERWRRRIVRQYRTAVQNGQTNVAIAAARAGMQAWETFASVQLKFQEYDHRQEEHDDFRERLEALEQLANGGDTTP